MKEPRARNSYRCPPSIWRGYTEHERLHFNKVYALIYYHREVYDPDKEVTQWEVFCRRIATASTFVFKRGKGVEIGVNYG